jgi:RNA polymerase sigma-70 factor (ECF subfamily)
VASSLSDPPEDSADSWADDPVSPWIEEIQAGINVERNFERLHERFHPRLFRYFFRKGIEPALCEELTQEVFVRVLTNLQGFERRSRFARWLFQIARRLYASEIRRTRTDMRSAFEVPLQEEHDTEDEDERRPAPALAGKERNPEEEAQHHEEVAALRKALATLPPQMRTCVLLRLYQDLKYREIAETLHVSIDTVKSQIGNAKIRLRKILQGGVAAVLAGLEEDSP